MKIGALAVAVFVAGGVAACGGSTTTVTQTQPAAAQQPQVQTVTQIVKTVTQKQSSPAPAPPDTGSGGGGGGGGQNVPADLVGQKLNDAEDELDGNGIDYTTEGGLVILRGDWGVCSTTPSAGQSVTGAVVLHVGHFKCGA